jgi:hypothetical protein
MQHTLNIKNKKILTIAEHQRSRKSNNNAVTLNLQENKETTCKAHRPQDLFSHHHQLLKVCCFPASGS